MSSDEKEVNPMGAQSEPLTIEERVKRLERAFTQLVVALARPPQRNDALDEIRAGLE
jgi:hypothetical protein